MPSGLVATKMQPATIATTRPSTPIVVGITGQSMRLPMSPSTAAIARPAAASKQPTNAIVPHTGQPPHGCRGTASMCCSSAVLLYSMMRAISDSMNSTTAWFDMNWQRPFTHTPASRSPMPASGASGLASHFGANAATPRAAAATRRARSRARACRSSGLPRPHPSAAYRRRPASYRARHARTLLHRFAHLPVARAVLLSFRMTNISLDQLVTVTGGVDWGTVGREALSGAQTGRAQGQQVGTVMGAAVGATAGSAGGPAGTVGGMVGGGYAGYRLGGVVGAGVGGLVGAARGVYNTWGQ